MPQDASIVYSLPHYLVLSALASSPQGVSVSALQGAVMLSAASFAYLNRIPPRSVLSDLGFSRPYALVSGVPEPLSGSSAGPWSFSPFMEGWIGDVLSAVPGWKQTGDRTFIKLEGAPQSLRSWLSGLTDIGTLKLSSLSSYSLPSPASVSRAVSFFSIPSTAAVRLYLFTSPLIPLYVLTYVRYTRSFFSTYLSAGPSGIPSGMASRISSSLGIGTPWFISPDGRSFVHIDPLSGRKHLLDPQVFWSYLRDVMLNSL